MLNFAHQNADLDKMTAQTKISDTLKMTKGNQSYFNEIKQSEVHK